MASITLLVLGVLSLLAVANALHARRQWTVLMASWAASMLALEFAPLFLVLAAALTAWCVAAGALAGAAGWAGLVIMAVSWIGWIELIRRSLRCRGVLEAAGADVRLDPEQAPGEQLDPRPAPAPFPLSHVLLPFLMFRRRGVTRTGGIVYHEPPGRWRLKLDVYRPAGPAPAPRPGILQIHGGAWVMGSRREQGIPLCNHLAANGWVVLNADYGLSPKVTWPEHLIDLKRAVAWYREHAAEYGADPGFLCVTGGSAGGHLASMLALTPNRPEYQPGFEDVDTTIHAAVPFYGVYDWLGDMTRMPASRRLLERLVVKRRLADDREAYEKGSPVHWIGPDAPPFFVINGDVDTLTPVEEADRFVERLRAVSPRPVVLARLPGAQHAFDLLPSYRVARTLEAVERFLSAVHRHHLAGRDRGPGRDAVRQY
ncbi:alpha/beta hydrolase [Bailinhaonella thermotolerans]|nr:alpha/beta hydrolase [Bailinhaonella thermotolerans]